MRVLHLYRPRLPGVRAQAVQVAHVAHALAERGHTVTLLADRGAGATSPADALAALGLRPLPTLDLRLAPVGHKGLAGWWFRRQVAAWWAGPPGVVLARDKRRLVDAVAAHGPRHTVALETHELDSALAADAGRDPAPVRALEAAAVSTAAALVANCGGTLAAWQDAGLALPSVQVVAHNGTAVRPLDRPLVDELRCVGSLRAMKGVDAILDVAPRLPLPLVWVGGTDAERARVAPRTGLTLRPPVPHPAVGPLLAEARCLLVPLQDNRFGRSLTSPLKLWDALASGRPVVAPDLPSIDEIAALTGRALHRYSPGDPDGLVAAVAAAAAAPPPTPVVRPWADRAAELEAVFAAAGAG